MKHSAFFLLWTLSSSQIGRALACATTGCADPNHCCSQWGFCGTGDAYCGDGCQNGPCGGGGGGGNYNYCGVDWTTANNQCGTPCYDGTPTPCPTGETCFADATACPLVNGPSGGPPTTPSPTKMPVTLPPNNNPPAIAGDDSRLIAYVGNWQACPTPEQVDSYTHIVIAFAVSYTWAQSKNNCDAQCNVVAPPICNNQPNQALVDSWRAAGKKVILSFGGAGMGGSWSGDLNNCWDYCFEKEEALAQQLVNIVDTHNYDGIDIDYEYCYDGGCPQRTSAYTDVKAQTFLNLLTSKLRVKLDALQASNGYNRGRYEVTHAPMDSDLVTSSKYYEILQQRNADLDFLMPQFYNGITKPITNFQGALDLYNGIANGIFNNEPEKVVFGFCISDCGGTGSNTNAQDAVAVMSNVQANTACNGGAFFWVAAHDVGGAWSDSVWGQVSSTTGCLAPGTPSPSRKPTSEPTKQPSTSPTKAPVLTFPGTCSDGSGVCSATDTSQCTCSRRRNLSKGKEIESQGLRGKHNVRKLARKPKTPPTPNPTPPPAPLTPPPTDSPTKKPTQSPTKSPTPFECTCVLPTPEPTPNPTIAVTPSPTRKPTTDNCLCDATQKNLCEACSTCQWSGRHKECIPR